MLKPKMQKIVEAIEETDVHVFDRRLLILTFCYMLLPAIPAQAQMAGNSNSLMRIIPLMVRNFTRNQQYNNQNSNGHPAYSNTNPGGYPSKWTNYDQQQAQGANNQPANDVNNVNTAPPNYAQQAYQNGLVQPYSGAYNTGYSENPAQQQSGAALNAGNANTQVLQTHAETVNRPGYGQNQLLNGYFPQPAYTRQQGPGNYVQQNYTQNQPNF